MEEAKKNVNGATAEPGVVIYIPERNFGESEGKNNKACSGAESIKIEAMTAMLKQPGLQIGQSLVNYKYYCIVYIMHSPFRAHYPGILRLSRPLSILRS